MNTAIHPKGTEPHYPQGHHVLSRCLDEANDRGYVAQETRGQLQEDVHKFGKRCETYKALAVAKADDDPPLAGRRAAPRVAIRTLSLFFFLLRQPLSDVWWLPTNRHRLPTNRHRLHTNRQRLPTNRHQLPTNRHRLHTNRHRLPTNRHRLPTNRHRLPTNRQSYPPTAIGYPPTAIGYPPTAINYPPTAIGYTPTAIGYPPTAIDYPPTAIGYTPTAIGYTPTAIGYPPTAIIYPPTAISYPPAAIIGRIGHSEFFSFYYGNPWAARFLKAGCWGRHSKNSYGGFITQSCRQQ